MKYKHILMTLVVIINTIFIGSYTWAKGNGKLKVFVMAGQSNMVGYGMVKNHDKRKTDVGTMVHYVKQNPKKYKKLVKSDGSYVVRDDVWVVYPTAKKHKGKFLPKKSGWLTTGFGASSEYIGPEYAFGMVLGNYYKDPVLIIKCAWGGKSLGHNFLPPSSEKYPKPEKDGDKGFQYAETVRITKEVLSDIKKYFPDYDGKGYELVGFGWHQGWNDRVNQERVDAYAKNMENFIKDIRKYLGFSNLPFVIANTGIGGHELKAERAIKLMKDQLSMADPTKYPAFKGNVGVVDTRDFQRKREDSPSKQGYHWFRNWETYYLIGEAMGEKMVELLKNK